MAHLFNIGKNGNRNLHILRLVVHHISDCPDPNKPPSYIQQLQSLHLVYLATQIAPVLQYSQVLVQKNPLYHQYVHYKHLLKPQQKQ